MSNIEELMARGNNTQGFILPGMTDEAGDFDDADLREDMAGMQMSLQRVKIPTGGVLQFEIPSDNPERPAYTEYLDGVILFSNPVQAYWPEGERNDEDEDAKPLCSSWDGITGHGDPGGACAVCPLNQWNTGKNGKGKACRNMRHLYILRSGEYMPIQLNLAPTSIRPYNDFYNSAFAMRRRATYGSVVRIGLKRLNNGKDDYSVATFQKVYDFSGEELAQIKAYSAGFREQIKWMLSQRQNETESAEGSEPPIADLESLQQAIPVGAGVSTYSSVPPINGDQDLLF